MENPLLVWEHGDLWGYMYNLVSRSAQGTAFMLHGIDYVYPQQLHSSTWYPWYRWQPPETHCKITFPDHVSVCKWHLKLFYIQDARQGDKFGNWLGCCLDVILQWHLVLFSSSPLPSPFLSSNIVSVREIEIIVLNNRKCVPKGVVISKGRKKSLFYQENENMCPGLWWWFVMVAVTNVFCLLVPALSHSPSSVLGSCAPG